MEVKDLEGKIINADCMDILKELPNKCIDLILTDPPYGGGGDLWKCRKRGRFGGWFDKYHISSADRRRVLCEVQAPGKERLARQKEVQPTRGCL